MRKRFIRFFDVLAILAVLMAQLGLLPNTATRAVAAPAEKPLLTFGGVTLSNVSVNSGGSVAYMAPGSSFNLSFDYSIVDTECPGCIDQIEIGYTGTSAPFTCVYSDIPGREGDSGSAALELTAPATPGVYYLAFDRAQHYSCAEALRSGWWNGVPTPEQTDRYVARIIVATQVVNSVADTNDGTCDLEHCTLREAINDANASEESDYIVFDIPGEGPRTISPLTVLPAITGPTVIDGYSQAGATPNSLAVGDNATLLIELDGDSCSPAPCAQGLLLNSGGSTIRGLAIHGNFNNGIEVNGAESLILGNFFGVRANGTPHGVAASGIYLNNTLGNTIGGSEPADRNVISNNRDGIFIAAGAANASSNLILGNYIGTDPSGIQAQGNRQRGIFVGSFGYVASNNVIRGNLISGNGHFGVLLRDGNVTFNTISGNLIGLDAFGEKALPNGRAESNDDGLAGTNARAGVYIAGSGNIIGGAEEGDGNIIAFNDGAGVLVAGGSGTNVRGNNIFSNAGLGIDLAGDGLTFNHLGVIDGPNSYQNFPVLTVATSDGGTTRVGGELDGAANQNYSIDVYANQECDPSYFGEGRTFIGSIYVTTDANGIAIFDQTLNNGVVEPRGVSATATSEDGTSEFSYCRPVSTSNLNWVQAQTVESGAPVSQYISDVYQEKWFKFPVTPGSTVSVKLTSLPGSAVSLHRDPFPIYEQLINPENGAALGAEAGNTAFLPSGSLPSGSLPSGSLPSGSLPSGSLPSGSLPTGYLPSGSLPSGSLPSGSLPSGSLPSGSLPSGSLPSGSLPSGSLPSGSLPSGSLPSGSLPSGSLPSGSLPSGSLPSGSLPSGSLDAYASAARNSLMGISMDPYATVQTIERNTYDLQENLYVRVVGPYNLDIPFTLDVTVTGGVCEAIQPVDSETPVFAGPVPASGSLASLILTDSSRLPGTPAEVTQALVDLNTFAQRSDVNGVVIDFASGAYPRVNAAQAQAGQNVGCAFAKNILAGEIKQVIDGYRTSNPTLQYIVLAGGADVIPFFQVPDLSGLAYEKEYVPPVAPSSASEAALQSNLVLGQDAYGSQVNITQAGFTVALPNLAVGRLVSTASDISAAVNAYVQTDGVVAPDSSLVTGYDFVGDAAVAVQAELEAGTNASAETLIQAPGLPPTDATAWSANQLRTKLFAGNHDIVMLSGHFSAGNLLAADYTTQLAAAELLPASVDMSQVLVMTLGCHGGYNIPNSDLLSGISPDPDWAEAFLRKGAAGYIAATGYAYGDTELVEYGERLFLLVSQQLRTGNAPVSVGQALVKAKQQYLAETAQLTGIDQKTLVQMTLYGFPMMKVDMPGARILTPGDTSVVASTAPVGSGPGAGFGLVSGAVSLNPTLATQTKTLPNLVGGPDVTTTYLTGTNGVVVNPFEPIYPKEIDNVSVNGNVLRGVAFRGGTYADLAGIIPLTSSPTTETSTAHLSYNTAVFYPTQLWAPNYSDAVLGGATRLITFPAQFRSSAPGAIDGTLRKFNTLDLQLFYLPSNWNTANSPAALKAAGVSAAPNILGVTGTENGNQIDFRVTVVTEGSAGVQAVWILYTGKLGSAYHGTWAPLDLVRDPNDNQVWKGSLLLGPGESAEDVLFMAQSVGGAGLTTLATNLGAYYNVNGQNAGQNPPPAPTTLDLIAPPASGTYLQTSSFTALLRSNGVAVSGQLVSVDVNGQQAFGFTGADGKVTLSLNLLSRPGNYTLQAKFGGSVSYLGANATSAFTINKDSTSLSLTPLAATVAGNQSTPFVATLSDSLDRPLGGKSVFFVVRSGATTVFAKSVITDFQGRALLGEVSLPDGNYTVDVYFSGSIPVSPAITLNDDYYTSSAAGASNLTILSDTTPPTITAAAFNADNTPYIADTWTNQTVTVHFTCSDADSGVASCPADQVFSADGTFTATGAATDHAGNSASTSFGPIKIDKTAPSLTASVSPNPVYLNGTATVTPVVTDAGSGIASQSCGSISTNTVGAKTVTCTATDNAGNTATFIAEYRVIYRFDGFLQPINDTGHAQLCGPSCTVSIFKGGSTVPVKFQLKDANGVVVQSVSLPVWVTPQRGAATTAAIDESVYTDPASSGNTFHLDGSQYVYNWSTKGVTAGYYWRIGVRLDDGQTYYVVIGLR